MTTLCLCDWVEASDDGVRRPATEEPGPSADNNDHRRFPAAMAPWPALPDWPDASLWADPLTGDLFTRTMDAEERSQ
jgi:hypothetical protein